LHALVALALVLAPELTDARPETFEVELTMEALPPEPTEASIAEVDAAEVSPPTETGARGRITRPTASPLSSAIEPTATVEGLVPLEGLVPTEERPLSVPEEDAAVREERIRRALDPGRIAREMVIDEDPGPIARGEPAGGGDRVGGLPPEVAPLTEEEAEGRHGGFLRERAMLREWLSHHAIEPHERPDGSWVYEGPLFTATIMPDGRVEFDDRDPISVDFATGTATFDLMDMVMSAAGQDPFQAEHERFMEETEALRLGIEGEWHEREVARRYRFFVGSLSRIWGETDRPASRRRRSIFEAWDETSEDDDEGRACRAAVIDFVRNEIPFGSEDAYSEAELGVLNALRASSARFEPY
jgi:hypothetical protein